MYKKIQVSKEEKDRILNLHESVNKNISVNESSTLKDPTRKDSYPLCVQQFGDPTKGDQGYWGINGNNNFSGYRFYNNFRVIDRSRNVNTYFCKGNIPYLGDKVSTTKGSKTSTVGFGVYGENKILKIGSTGDLVKKVQNELSKVTQYGGGQRIGGNPNCGNDINSCDGKFGKGTHDAVRLFQEKMKQQSGDQNMKVDGIVGDETWQQLFGGFEMEDSSKDNKKHQTGTYAGGYVGGGRTP